MERIVSLLVLAGLLIIGLLGCGSTPEPTLPPTTQTAASTSSVATQAPPTLAPTEEEVAATPTRPLPTPTRPPKATPTERAEATATRLAATAEPTATASAVPAKPTETVQPAYKYPAPSPLAPTDGVSISWNYSVLLEWSPVGELAADEYYYLHLDAVREVNGEPWYGDYVFVKEAQYRAEGTFLAPFRPPEEKGRAVVSWWVEVVRKTGEDANGKPLGEPLSPVSEKWTFITEPKPGD